MELARVGVDGDVDRRGRSARFSGGGGQLTNRRPRVALQPQEETMPERTGGRNAIGLKRI